MALRVLWLSHIVPFPPIGGVLQRSHNLLSEVAKHHQVDLISFAQRTPLITHFGDYDTGIARAKEALQEICGEVQFFPISSDWERFGMMRIAAKSLVSRNGYTMKWLESEAFKQRLGKLSDGYDIVHIDTISLAIYRSLFKGPAVLNHHNIESDMMKRRATKERHLLKRIYFKQEAGKLERYEREVCEQFDQHLTCSELDGAKLTAINEAAAVSVVPNGIHPEFMDADYLKTGESHSLLFAGRFSAYANQAAARRLVNDIWPALVKENGGERYRLTLAGSNPGDYLLSKPSFDNRILVTGFVEDIKPYFAEAGIFVCPIDDGGGTRLKILDALAMGKAVVAHPVSCEGLPLEDKKHLLFATSTHEFVSAIRVLGNDRAYALKLARDGQDVVKKQFSYSRIGQDYAQLLSRIAGQ
ncbi:MAG: glycosyltransferase family 4 protein [Immundisolibacteraceae bacterium]|nr:glycosyltransferase family 4 protein [Immundisolibacteraceae bacterium]